MSTKPDNSAERSSPSRIMDVGMGFWPAKTLLSAVELGVFTELGGDGMSGDQLQLSPILAPLHGLGDEVVSLLGHADGLVLGLHGHGRIRTFSIPWWRWISWSVTVTGRRLVIATLRRPGRFWIRTAIAISEDFWKWLMPACTHTGEI